MAADSFLHPVCCIAEIPVEVLNRLLSQSLTGSEALVRNSEHQLKIVEKSDDGSSTSTSRLPDHISTPPLDDDFKPFIASSIGDAARHVGNASHFAVVDEQSAKDDSALLVERREGGGGGEGEVPETARVTFEQVQISLVSLSVGCGSVQEIRCSAESQGGIYGSAMPTRQKGGPAPRKQLGSGS